MMTLLVNSSAQPNRGGASDRWLAAHGRLRLSTCRIFVADSDVLSVSPYQQTRVIHLFVCRPHRSAPLLSVASTHVRAALLPVSLFSFATSLLFLCLAFFVSTTPETTALRFQSKAFNLKTAASRSSCF